MRTNEPITRREFDLPGNATLMSTTDTQSRITYVNEAFVHASGFAREELMGQPHNLVRHPDMPPAAFADMWATLKAGEPWTALVKNRRKDGDHYWVRANAIPIVREGRQLGYMSVRTKPGRDETAAAEAIHRDFQQGGAAGRRFHKGLVVRRGMASILSWHQILSVRARIRLTMTLAWLFGAGCSALFCSAWLSWVEATGLMALAAGAVCLVFERQFAAPLELLLRQALAVATGDSREITGLDRVDEIGMTLRTIGQLGLMFRWLVDDVSQQVMSVQGAVNEVAGGNVELSSRTEQAAASVAQTASTTEQLNATVRNNADTAARVDALSSGASSAAEHGGRAVQEVIDTMSQISSSSRRIADITGVIDGIAFQTNILALNAAVEAARAGEQGRGFAVVASEVRGLAQRSSEAAREIKSLIGASVDRVEAGSRLVDLAGQSMADIQAQVDQVSTLIGEISTASREQSGGIAQVSLAVGHLDRITQQNAALVEKGAATSRSLRERTGQLVEAVAVFR